MAEKRDSKKKLLPALALLALLGITGGAFLRAVFRGGAERGKPSAGLSREGGRVALTPQAEAIWSKLLAALSAKGGKPVTIERLLQLFLKGGSDPLATAFAEDFMRDPELASIWNEYLRSQGKLDANWLANRLAESKGFAALVNRYSNHWRFRRLGDSLAKALSGEAASDGAASLFGEGGAHTGSAPGSGPGGGREAGSARAYARGLHGEMTGGGANAGSPGRTEAAPGSPPGEAHQTLKLIAPIEAGPSVERDPWASLCYQGGAGISREQCAAINRYLGEDALWNACMKAGLLDKCVTLCRGNLELGCEDQAREMQHCRQSASAEACADACSKGDCRAAIPSEPEPRPEPTVAQLPPDGGQENDSVENAVPEPRPGPAGQPGSPPGEAPPPSAPPPPAGAPPDSTNKDVVVPFDHAVPRANTTPTPPPQPAPQPKKKKHRFPPTWDEIVDFFEDLFG
ncbi:MAG: hypothetical protein HY925_02305 [Elusimicrobia bacterium]|nr:hypothetical protein [Elusimicrobiota bacterium]